MTMIGLYHKIGGDYQTAQLRLGNEKMIERFIRRFVDDKTFERLKSAYDANDEAAIYKEACDFVEICGSLSLNRLAETAGAIMAAYRPGNASNRDAFRVTDLFDVFFEQYYSTVVEIKRAFKMDKC